MDLVRVPHFPREGLVVMVIVIISIMSDNNNSDDTPDKCND